MKILEKIADLFTIGEKIQVNENEIIPLNYPQYTDIQKNKILLRLQIILDTRVDEFLVIRRYGKVYVIKINNEIILPFILKDYGEDYKSAYYRIYNSKISKIQNPRKADFSFLCNTIAGDETLLDSEVVYYVDLMEWVLENHEASLSEENWL